MLGKPIIGLFLLLLLATSAWADEGGKETVAVAAAEKWLTMIDAGEYAQSWTEAADYFKAAVAQSQWEQSLRAVRQPLGGLVSREKKSAASMTTLPGAPDGEYVVMQFATSFANKHSAIETVTAMLGADGSWRVAGYFIK